MSSIRRREFLKLVGAASAAAAFPFKVGAATTAPRVVVVGGGFGGATAAKYLKLAGGNIDVTLVDPNAAHISCILSNLVLTNTIDPNRIVLGYDTLSAKHGVRVVQERALNIDMVNRTVQLSSGQSLPYDHLVLSPGIDFVPIPGWDPTIIPHAWQAGEQTVLLQNQLAAIPAGGTFVMTIPKAPYRCPPGPYERACIVADYLRANKPGSRVIVLDANPGIVVEADNFGNAFNVTYSGIVEYYPNATVTEVDSATRTVSTTIGDFSASVLNVIPDQQAGRIVRDAGLATVNGHWAGVDPLTYGSVVAADIHVIGDSQATPQPKSGHMANSQAKVCADAILRSFAGLAPDPAPMTNSACFSPLSLSTASWLTAVYRYDATAGSMKLVSESFGASPGPSSVNYKNMFTWADSLFKDSFS